MGTTQEDLLERIRQRKTLRDRIRERKASPTEEEGPAPPVVAERDEPSVLSRIGRGARGVGRLAARAVPGGEPLIQREEEEPDELAAPAEDRGSILDMALSRLRDAPERADASFSPAVEAARSGRGLEALPEVAPDVVRQVGRGASEVGFRAGVGASELVGADQTAANLRADRELAREVYGEPETGAGLAANIGTQLIGEGALFMTPGTLAMRLGRASGVITKTGELAEGAARGGRFLKLLANPQGAAQRAVQTFLTGAPIDVAISQAGPEESMAGAIGALTNDEELLAISRDPIATGAFEVVAGFAAGQILGEVLHSVAGGARGSARNLEELGRIVARAEAAGATLPDDVLRQIDELPDEARQTVLGAFGEEQDRLAEAVSRETELETAPETPRGAPTGERAPEVREAQGAPQQPAPRPESEADIAPRSAEPEQRRSIRSRIADAIDPERAREMERLYQDELTGLPNEQAWRRAKPRLEEDPDTELVMIDLRNFKAINDNLGMEAGDRTLAEVADALRGLGVDERDVFRAGGDEFVVAAPAGEGERIGRRAQEAIGEKAIGDTEFEFSARYGVGQTFDEADRAAAAAKKAETGPRARDVVSQEAPDRRPDAADVTSRVEARRRGETPEPGTRARIKETGEDADFDVLEAGDEVEVLAVDDVAGTAEIRIRYPRGDEHVFSDIPQEVLEPIRSGPDLDARVARRRELQEEGPEARVPWSDREIAPAATGRSQSTLLPGDGSKIETEFAVVEAGDVRASHTPDFTQRTPDEFPPEIQGRAYHGARGRQAREFTEEMMSRFDPDRAFDPTISIAEGPPTITRSGVNVAGNGRTIAQQRMYQMQPDRARQLIQDELVARAEEFGLDPDAIRGMDQPMLVRRVTDDAIDQLDVDELRRINQSSDVATGKAKDVVSEAASRAGQMRSAEGALRHFSDTIDEDATIRSYLETADGVDFLRRLVDDGVIASAERARFIDASTGAPTAEGKNMVEQIMFAAAVGDPDVLARAPAASLRKMDTALPAIIRANRVEGFELEDTIRDALDLLARARAEGIKLDDLIAQADFTRPDVDPRIAQMARFLEDAPKNTRGSTLGVKDAFRQYADEAEAFARQTESDDLFGFEPRGPEEARSRFAALAPGEEPPAAIAEGPELTVEQRAAAEVFDRSFSESQVRLAKTAQELLEITDAHPLVREAQQRPQPDSGRDTWALHGGENPTPERAAKRETWRQTIDDNGGYADPADRPFDGPVARDRKAVIILGPPASGKSTVADPMVERYRARLLDSDEVKKLIPEFEGGTGSGAVHDESSFINGRQMLPEAVERGENLIWPTVGSEAGEVMRKIEVLRRAGYEVHVALNEVPATEAAKRAWARFLATDRWVSMRYVLGIGDKPRNTFDVVKEAPGVTSAQRFDNDVPKGTPPILRESVGEPGELRGLRGDRGEALRAGAPGDRAAPGRKGEGLPEVQQTRVAKQVQRGRGPGSTAHPLSRDLFGEPVEGTARQEDLLPDRRGPQGTTEALEQARATVSRLEGRIARGGATSREEQLFEEARSLVRRLEGRGLDAGEVSARARERGAPQEPSDTGDLFGAPAARPLAPSAQVGEQLPAAGRFYDKPEARGAELVPAPQIIEELGEAIGDALEGLGLKVATGKLPRGGIFARAVATFDPRRNVARQLNIADVPAFGHEAGHAMHKMFFGTTPEGRLRSSDFDALPGAIRGELEDLGEGISGGGTTEGWAELWRRYLDNPEDLQTSAPNALRFIEERLEEFGAVREAWNVARTDYRAHRESSAQARIASAISVGDREPAHLSIKDRWSRARTAVLDDMEPVRRVVQKIRDEVGLESITEEADALARLTRGSVGVANHFLEHGVLDFRTLRNVGPSLKQVLEPVTENLDEFRRYMVARRAQELHERDILTGLRDEDVNAVVEQLDGKYGDTFSGAFDAMQEWNRGLLGYLRDSGVISAKSYDAIVELNQSYVPFYRVTGGERGGAGLGANFGHLFSPVKRIKGSGRTIIDPIESMVKNALTYTQIAQKQQVSRALAELAEKPGVGKVLEEMGNPIQRTQFRLGEIEKQLEDILPGSDELLEDLRAAAKRDYEEATKGLDEDEIRELGIREEDPGEEIMAVFRPGDMFSSPNTISVLRDGKRVWYEVDEEMFAALQGLDREQLGAWVRWMGVPARTLRAGATLAPEFLIRNPLRDQVMAFVQSEYGYVPFVDMAKGAFELMRKGETYRQWISAGGYRAALTSLDRNAMQGSLRQLVDEGGVANVIKHPLDALQALSAVMEDATRVGEFINARAVEGTSKEGLQRAALASREISVDFARHGAKTAALRHISAFWNARLQGYDRLARAAKKNPGRFAAKSFTMITLPSLLEYAANRDDPDYWEQPQWKRDLFWMIKIGDDFVSIPKPFELGLIFGTLPVRIIDSAIGGPGGGHELQDFLFDSLLKGESSGFLPQPQAFMPLLENTVDYSFFLRRPIVPRSEQEVEARFQAGPFTSEVAQMIGRWSPGEQGISPREIDNLLFAWTGGLGRLATEATDPLLEGRIPFTEGDVAPVARRAVDIPGLRGVTDPTPGFSSESVERFYELYSRARTADSTLRFLERSQESEAYQSQLQDAGRGELRSMLPMLRDVAGQLAEIRSTVDAIRRDPDMSSREKRDEIDALGRQAREIAASALGRNLPGG